MDNMTITEALADIKTIDKRIMAKRQVIGQYVARMDGIKDPLEKDGGSVKVITEAMQAIRDLEERIVELRRRIRKANETTHVTIEGDTRSISDWLVWRREVSPQHGRFIDQLNQFIIDARAQAKKHDSKVINGLGGVSDKPTDVVVCIDEKKTLESKEKLSLILGQLDGLLSLKNATIMV